MKLGAYINHWGQPVFECRFARIMSTGKNTSIEQFAIMPQAGILFQKTFIKLFGVETKWVKIEVVETNQKILYSFWMHGLLWVIHIWSKEKSLQASGRKYLMWQKQGLNEEELYAGLSLISEGLSSDILKTSPKVHVLFKLPVSQTKLSHGINISLNIPLWNSADCMILIIVRISSVSWNSDVLWDFCMVSHNHCLQTCYHTECDRFWVQVPTRSLLPLFQIHILRASSVRGGKRWLSEGFPPIGVCVLRTWHRQAVWWREKLILALIRNIFFWRSIAVEI